MKIGDVTIKADDIFMFQFLYKFRLASTDTLAILLNRNIRSLQRRLTLLVKGGLLERKRLDMNEPYFYSLTNKAYSTFINDNARVYQFSALSYLHESTLALVGACILRDNDDVSLDDLITERDVKRMKHGTMKGLVIADLYVNRKSLAIEVERSNKTLKQIRKKLITNHLFYKNQVWVIPRQYALLRKRVKEFPIENDEYMVVRFVDEIPQKNWTLRFPSYELKMIDTVQMALFE